MKQRKTDPDMARRLELKKAEGRALDLLQGKKVSETKVIIRDRSPFGWDQTKSPCKFDFWYSH